MRGKHGIELWREIPPLAMVEGRERAGRWLRHRGAAPAGRMKAKEQAWASEWTWLVKRRAQKGQA